MKQKEWLGYGALLGVVAALSVYSSLPAPKPAPAHFYAPGIGINLPAKPNHFKSRLDVGAYKPLNIDQGFNPPASGGSGGITPAFGTSGQVLSTAAGGASYQWITVGGTGTVTLVSTTSTPSWLTATWTNAFTTPALTIASAGGLTSHQVLGTFAGSTISLGALTAADLPAAVAYTNVANAWAADQKPSVAGANNLGSGLLPWGNLFVGSAANQAVSFVTSALTANRAITVPDAASNTVQPLGSATTSNVVQWIGSNGVQHLIQLAFSDITGALTAGQLPSTTPDATGVSTVGWVPTITGLGTWSWQAQTGSGGGMANPMTTLGDIIFGSTGGSATRLGGNTTTTPEYYKSVGSGGVATAPTLAQVIFADIANTCGVGQGGTGTGTAPSAGQLLVAASSSAYAPVTASGDLTNNSSGVFTLKNTGPGAGSFTTANITIDNQGRITAATNGSGGGGGGFTANNKSASFSAVAQNSYFVSANATCTLPTAVGVAGQEIEVILTGSGLSVPFNTTSAQTVSGQASGAITATTQYNAYRFMSDNANWYLE